MNNSQDSNKDISKYSDKTASYYAGMPFGQLLVKTMERAQMASLQQNYILEFTLLRDYYSYSSSFMNAEEQKTIKDLFTSCDKLIKSITYNRQSNTVATQNLTWALGTKLFDIKEKLFAYTSDLLNKASQDDEVDLDEEIKDI